MGWLDKIREAFGGTPQGTAAPPAHPEPPPPTLKFPAESLLAFGIKPNLVSRYLPYLNLAADKYEINNFMRRTMFLAQVAHESGMFAYSHELWGPTEAQLRYEGRADLGNVRPGDGYLFRGRGLIQITGRRNYTLAAHAFGYPSPETVAIYLASPEGACYGAAWFWWRAGCNELADAQDFTSVTRRINGGLNGFSERLRLWVKAKEVLTP